MREIHGEARNKPSTQEGYQSVTDRNIIPMLGRMKVLDVKRPSVAAAMKKITNKPADANQTFSVMRCMFNLAEVWGYRPDGTNPCHHAPTYPNGKATHLINNEDIRQDIPATGQGRGREAGDGPVRKTRWQNWLLCAAKRWLWESKYKKRPLVPAELGQRMNVLSVTLVTCGQKQPSQALAGAA